MVISACSIISKPLTASPLSSTSIYNDKIEAYEALQTLFKLLAKFKSFSEPSQNGQPDYPGLI